MLNLRILTDINASDKKKANIQYSYPVAKVTNLSTNKYLLNFYGLNQNFSASVFDSYISGVCINATFYKNRHNTGIEHSAELVLEHKTPNSQTFHVVIPVNSGTESNLDNIVSEDPVLELNSLLKKKSIFYYQDTDDNHVFVFQNPISMSILPSLQDIHSQYTVVSNTDQDNQSIKKYAIVNFEKCKSDCDENANCAGMITSDNNCWTIKAFPNTYYNSGYSLHRKGQTFNKGIKKKEKFYYGFLTNAQNIEDEIQCEYVTQTDANVNPANQQMVSDIFVWTSITLGLILCLFYFLKLINEKISIISDAELIYKVISGIGLLMLVIYIRLFTNTTTKRIQYGSMTIFSLIAIGLSLMAYNKVLF